MSLDKVIVFAKPLKAVTLENDPALQAALTKSYERGYQEASDKFNAQILEMRQQLQAHAKGVLKNVETAHEKLTLAISNELPELISAGVWKIVGQEAMPVEILRSRVESIVKESCPANEPVEVRMNPADLADMQKADENFAARSPRLSFKADESLSRGDCVMETKFGKIDATLKTQIKRLVEELQNH